MAEVDGSNILYHYLQKDLRKSEFPLYLQMVMKLVTDLGVWIHPDDYKKLPITLPYVVRDPMLKTQVRKPWGNPQPNTGLMMDDNLKMKQIREMFSGPYERDIKLINRPLLALNIENTGCSKCKKHHRRLGLQNQQPQQKLQT